MSSVNRQVLLSLGTTGRKTLPQPVMLRERTVAQLLILVDQSTTVDTLGLKATWCTQLGLIGTDVVVQLYDAIYRGEYTVLEDLLEFQHTYPTATFYVNSVRVTLPQPFWELALCIGLAIIDNPATVAPFLQTHPVKVYVTRCIESMAFQWSRFETH